MLHPDGIADFTGHRAIQIRQELHDRRARTRTQTGVGEKATHQGTRSSASRALDRHAERRQITGQQVGIAKRERLGVVLHEEVERVDDGQVGHQVHGDVEFAHRLRENQSRNVISERILLPVQEQAGRFDAQRVRLDRRTRMGRRAEPDEVRTEHSRTLEPVGRPVFESDAGSHVSILRMRRGPLGSSPTTQHRGLIAVSSPKQSRVRYEARSFKRTQSSRALVSRWAPTRGAPTESAPVRGASTPGTAHRSMPRRIR